MFFSSGDIGTWSATLSLQLQKHSCIWCEASKDERHNMNLKWSISDTQQGARTIEEISNISQLSKKNKINTIVITKSAHYEAWYVEIDWVKFYT